MTRVIYKHELIMPIGTGAVLLDLSRDWRKDLSLEVPIAINNRSALFPYPTFFNSRTILFFDFLIV